MNIYTRVHQLASERFSVGGASIFEVQPVAPRGVEAGENKAMFSLAVVGIGPLAQE